MLAGHGPVTYSFRRRARLREYIKESRTIPVYFDALLEIIAEWEKMGRSHPPRSGQVAARGGRRSPSASRPTVHPAPTPRQPDPGWPIRCTCSSPSRSWIDLACRPKGLRSRAAESSQRRWRWTSPEATVVSHLEEMPLEEILPAGDAEVLQGRSPYATGSFTPTEVCSSSRLRDSSSLLHGWADSRRSHPCCA